MRKKHSAQFKAKIAIDAMRESQTMGELSSKHGVHRVQIQQWKKQVAEAAPTILATKEEASKLNDQSKLIDDLYREIGRLKVENDWLKKKHEIIDG